MSELLHMWRRRGLRRAFPARCQAVSLKHGRPVGDGLLDLSTRGALVVMDEEIDVGERILLSFQMPWLGPVVHVQAVVERVVENQRRDDPGYCAGVRFLGLAPRDRAELARRLSALPRTRAQRPQPRDYARMVRAAGARLEPASRRSL